MATEQPFIGLPFLGNVKAPLKAEMLLPVIIDEAGNGIVVAAGEYTRRGFLFLDCIEGVSVSPFFEKCIVSASILYGRGLTLLEVTGLFVGAGGIASL